MYGEWCHGPTGNNDCVHGRVIDRELLTVAHLHGDGKSHRNRIKSLAKPNLLLDLKRRGWPKDEGISVQCHNCQHKHFLIMVDFSNTLRNNLDALSPDPKNLLRF